jgi:hypothetical protein
MLRVRIVSVAVVFALALTGCGAKLVRSTHKVGSRQLIEKVGASVSPLPTDDAIATPAPTPKFSGPLFVLQLTDKNGGHPAGIPVQVSGPMNGVIATNGKGEIELFDHGTYHFAVVQGCSPSVEVFSGGSGTAGVVDGRTQHGALRVDWQHRFAPAPPVFSNPMAPWPVGKDVSVSFTVLDRCLQRFAPNVVYPTWRFATSPNLKLVFTPTLKSNAKSQGFVTVRCLSKGAVTLVAIDNANPKDTFNIARESSDYRLPSCA